MHEDMIIQIYFKLVTSKKKNIQVYLKLKKSVYISTFDIKLKLSSLRQI